MHTVRVAELPECDICKKQKANYDGKTLMGPWAYMCQECFDSQGVGLGTGLGQRLVTE